MSYSLPISSLSWSRVLHFWLWIRYDGLILDTFRSIMTLQLLCILVEIFEFWVAIISCSCFSQIMHEAVVKVKATKTLQLELNERLLAVSVC